MNAKIRVLVVDDHPIFRRGLREVIESDPQFIVTGEAGDGESAMKQLQTSPPHVMVVDVRLPGISGLELTRAARCQLPPVAVVMLTMDGEPGTFDAALDAGAQGYILKENAVSDVLVGLKAVAAGGVYYSPSVASLVVQRHRRTSALKERKKGFATLTPTERRILRLLAGNRTNKQIGRELFISHRTVETHRRHICEKLELSGSHALLQFALEHKSDLGPA
jgi:DNA-binding NarL/FixJ family response regulator